MKLAVHLCLIIVFVLFSSVSCNAFTDITVTGNGATKEAAIHDGLRSAIELVNGVLLLSETKVSNSVLESDNITTASNGYIKNYEVLSSVKANGYVSINLKVNVDSSSIDSFISRKMAMINVDEVDNDINVAKAKMNQIKSKIAFLNRANEQLAKNAYYAEVVGYKILQVKSTKVVVEIASRLMVNKFAWHTYNKIVSNFKNEEDIDVRRKIIKKSKYDGFAPSLAPHIKLASNNILLNKALHIRADGTNLGWCSDYANQSGQFAEDTIYCLERDYDSSSRLGYKLISRVIDGEGFIFNIVLELADPDVLKDITKAKYTVSYNTKGR